jgi:hypothetical protein
MEFDETPVEGDEPIRYEAPRIIEIADIEAKLAIISG